jgi:hypothetical protein
MEKLHSGNIQCGFQEKLLVVRMTRAFVCVRLAAAVGTLYKYGTEHIYFHTRAYTWVANIEIRRKVVNRPCYVRCISFQNVSL